MKRTASHVGWVLLVVALLVSAGCTGTDFLSSNMSPVRLEIVFDDTGAVIDYECINLRLDDVWVKPLDGICSAGSVNPGEPCLQTEDCLGGSCEGSSASEVITLPIQLNDATGSLVGNLTGELCDFTPGGLNPVFADPFVQPEPLLLTEGLYQLDTLDVGSVIIYDDDTEGFGSCDSTLTVGDDLGTDLRFTVPASGEKVIRLTAHIDVWEDELNGPDDCSIGDVLTLAFTCDGCDAAP